MMSLGTLSLCRYDVTGYRSGTLRWHRRRNVEKCAWNSSRTKYRDWGMRSESWNRRYEGSKAWIVILILCIRTQTYLFADIRCEGACMGADRGSPWGVSTNWDNSKWEGIKERDWCTAEETAQGRAKVRHFYSLYVTRHVKTRHTLYTCWLHVRSTVVGHVNNQQFPDFSRIVSETSALNHGQVSQWCDGIRRWHVPEYQAGWSRLLLLAPVTCTVSTCLEQKLH